MIYIFYFVSRNSKTNKEIVQPLNIEEEDEEEKEDNPDEPENALSDEENIPVPQVKVGPDGEIILDEKSLVIEQTGTKRGREQIENSEVIIDDLDTGYGIYKRPKKTKDWSASETLRFYRTLNTVGTDFSLMLSLFPGRTRRELKLKFKKEERINRVLIDRVLMNPLDFNLTELEQQFQAEEDERKKKKDERKKKDKDPQPRKKKSEKRSLLSREIDDENETIPAQKRVLKKARVENNNNPYTVLQTGINGIIDSDSESEDDANDKIREKRPTRQCRLNNPLNYSTNSDESDIEEIVLSSDDDNKTKRKSMSKSKLSSVLESASREFNKDTNVRETVISHTKSYLDDIESKSSDNDPLINDKANDDDVETNVVIAHSENSNLDRISIDIVSKKQDKTQVSLELKKEQEDGPEKIQKIAPKDLPQMEPGSLMIFSSTNPSGGNVFKVYMVTPNKENIPVDLAPDIVQSLTTTLGSAEEVVLDLPVISK